MSLQFETQYKTKITKPTLKKKKKACATFVNQSWREEGKASKVTKLEKEKNSKQKQKAHRRVLKWHAVMWQKEAGSGGSMRSGVSWRGEHRKGRGGRSEWE